MTFWLLTPRNRLLPDELARARKRVCDKNDGTVARHASTSEIGIESQIAVAGAQNPVTWARYGRIQMQGMRQMTWRRSERRIAVRGLPMDWKYVDAATFRPMHQSMQLETRRSPAARRTNPASVPSVKRRTIGTGANTASAAANDTTTVDD